MAYSFSSSPSASPQESLTGFFNRNARLIAGVGLFVTFWMLVYTFLVYKPGYAAKATVIIKDSAITSRYIEPEQYYALQTTSSSSSNPVLNTMGILKSGAISDALWAYFQAKHPEELKKNKIKTKKDWERFYQDGSAFIKAKNQPGTDLIAIQFSWSNPLIAKEALTVVVKAFQDASRDLNKEEQINRTKFLNKQVVEIEGQLSAIRSQKSAYQSDQRTVSVKREGDDLAGSRMELTNKLSQLESQALGKENMARRYQQLLGMDASRALKASAIGQNSSMSKLQDELYRLQQQYSLMNSSLTETNPKVREVQAQIDQVKANIEAEKLRTMGRQYAAGEDGIVADGTRNTLITNMLQAQGEAQDLRSQASVIRNRLYQIDRDIRTFPDMAKGLANIEQKEASLSAALDQLREKVLEGKLKEEQTLSNVFIVDAPRLPERPQFPNRNHLLVLSVMLGVGVGVATAFAREQFVSRNQYALPDWLEPVDDTDRDQGEQSVIPTETPQPEPEPEPVPLPAQEVPVTAQQQPALSLFAPEPAIAEERVLPPVIGSLFDSLVPVAGPMLQQVPNLPSGDLPSVVPFREDLTRPLPLLPGSTRPSQPLVYKNSQVEASPVTQQASQYSSQPASQPASVSNAELSVGESLPQPSRTVRVASPIDPAVLAALQARQPKQTITAHSQVPVLHASLPLSELPVADAPEQPQATEVSVSRLSPAAQPIADGINPVVDIITEPERSEASALYDAQAKEMPLPKKRRGLPAFLLDGQVDAADDMGQPYTLVPKKQLLSAEDDLMQDVAPLEPVGHPEVAAQNDTWPDEQDESLEPLNSPIPNFMREADYKAPRQSLLSGLSFGRKPSRHPERYFGLGSRAAKKQELPGSLTRMMHSLEKSR